MWEPPRRPAPGHTKRTGFVLTVRHYQVLLSDLLGARDCPRNGDRERRRSPRKDHFVHPGPRARSAGCLRGPSPRNQRPEVARCRTIASGLEHSDWPFIQKRYRGAVIDCARRDETATMTNAVLALVVLIGFAIPASAEILEPLGHACDEAWIREIKSKGTVFSDRTDKDERRVMVAMKVHDRPATVEYGCRGDVLIRHLILLKHENERDAQDTFERERRGLRDAVGRPCLDTTRPSSLLKRVANKLGVDLGTEVLWQASDHEVHLSLDPVGPGPDYWRVGLVDSIDKTDVVCDPPD